MGDNIILGINTNNNVQTSVLYSILKNLELQDAVMLSLHSFTSTLPIFNWNQNRKAIYAIWVSKNVGITQAGHMPFDNNPPDSL